MADKTIVVRVRADTGQYAAQLTAAGQRTVAFGNQLGTAAGTAQARMASFAKAASNFGKIVTLGVAGGLALSAKAAIDFESSFTGVQKTLDATPGQFARLSAEIRALSKEIPVNVNQLNSIAEIGGQLGVSVSGITDFTETIAKLGVTTNLSTDSAALGLARLANILGLSESQFENVGSSLVDLGNNFAATEDQILNFALRIAPVGQTVGLTADQVLALGTAFASVGVPAERGGTAVQRTFIEMAEAVLSGGDNLETFAKTAGKTTADFAKLFERDAAAALDSFLQGLDAINDSGGNLFEVLDDVNLGSQRTVQSLVALASAGNLLSTALIQGEDAFRTNIALQAEADLRFATTASKIEIAKNQMQDFAIVLGTEVLPVLGSVAESLGNFAVGLGELDGAAKNVISALALLVAGGTVSTKFLGKVMPAALQATATAAAGTRVALLGLRAVLGASLIGAVVGLVSVVATLGSRSQETEEHIEGLVTALEDLRRSGDDAPVIDQILEGLLDSIDILDRAGVQANTFAEAIAGDETALALVNEKLAAAQLELDGYNEAMAQATGANARDSQALIDRQLAFTRLQPQLLASADAQRLLAEQTELYAEALEREAKAFEEAGLLANLRAMAEGFESLDEKIKEDSLRGLSAAAAQAADGFGDMSEELEGFLDKMDELEGRVDASFGLLDAFTDLTDKMIELDKTADPSLAQLLDMSKAIEGVRRAAAEAGPEGIAPLISMLEAQRAAGFYTDAQFNQLLSTLLLIQPVAEAFGSGSNLLIGNLDVVRRAMAETGATGQELIAHFLGVEAAMRGIILNASTTASALALVTNKTNLDLLKLNVSDEEFNQLTGGLSVAFIEELQAKFAGLGSQLVDIGSLVATAVGQGVSSGGGAISTAIEDEIQDAIDAALGKVDTVISAVEAQLSSEQALRDLQEEEKNLVKLRREQKRLPDEILAAEARLARARRRAARVTLDEQLAIEQAEETLKRAKRAFEQGLITQTELDIAERDLRRARRDSTRENTDAVKEAKDRLQELKEREKEIALEIRDAELAVLEAKLDIVAAQLDMVSAAKEFNELGSKGKKIFKEWAREAGLTAKEIKEILDIAGESQGLLDDLLGGGSGSGVSNPAVSGGNREYIVQAGDSLSRIASNLGVTLDRILELNSTITNATTGQSRTLNPNVIFPGDIVKYHQGGVVPGNQFNEQLALLRGGEWVVDPRNPNSNIGGVTVENLVVRGIWDFSNPSQTRNMVAVMEQELESLRRARGVHSMVGG